MTTFMSASRIHILLLSLISLFLIQACDQESPGNLRIRFQNDTDYILEKLFVQDKAIEDLEPDAVSRYYEYEMVFKEFYQIQESIKAEVNGEETFYELSWCATEWVPITKGTHTYHIISREDSSQIYLYVTDPD